MICPVCNRRVPKSHFACESGARGGKAGAGKSKARSSEQARSAVTKRWERIRAAQAGASAHERTTKKRSGAGN